MKIPTGGYIADKIRGMNTFVREIDETNTLARPEPHRSIFYRLQQAWHVLTYKADAVYWREKYK